MSERAAPRAPVPGAGPRTSASGAGPAIGVLPSNEPLRIAVRRLRWFKAAFHRFAADCGAAIGTEFRIDDVALAAVFMRWIDALDRQRPAGRAERRAFFEFAASLMLREMLTDGPLTALAPPSRAGPASAAAFWPEGWCATMFCLAVHAAAMEQEFHDAPGIDPAIDDLRAWWSLRENAAAEPGVAAGFLQRMLGHQPNWTMPDVFRARMERDAC